VIVVASGSRRIKNRKIMKCTIILYSKIKNIYDTTKKLQVLEEVSQEEE
jgi:hypothetical protein